MSRIARIWPSFILPFTLAGGDASAGVVPVAPIQSAAAPAPFVLPAFSLEGGAPSALLELALPAYSQAPALPTGALAPTLLPAPEAPAIPALVSTLASFQLAAAAEPDIHRPARHGRRRRAVAAAEEPAASSAEDGGTPAAEAAIEQARKASLPETGARAFDGRRSEKEAPPVVEAEPAEEAVTPAEPHRPQSRRGRRAKKAAAPPPEREWDLERAMGVTPDGDYRWD